MKRNLGLIAALTGIILVSFTSCNQQRERESAEDILVSGEAPIRIMPLGNSITYGNYHPEPRPEGMITGYRQALWLMLKEAGYHVDFVGSRTTGADAEPAFDAHNEGYPGWTDDQIKANVYKWLKKNPADIVILHIGTNGLDPDPSDVEGILDEIDRYEERYNHHIKVIMAKIINRSTYSQLTTQFNQNIEKMALDRVVEDGDDIMVIDMEFETHMDYRLNTQGGEMFDNLHPFEGGHRKMAIRWFEALKKVLPKPGESMSQEAERKPVVATRDQGSRVEEGLVALWDFTEGMGNLVHDISGVGMPLDLFISNPKNVTWDAEQGLEITRESLLVPSRMNMKVIDSCMASGEISLEAWIRTGNMEQGGPAHIITISDPLQTGISLSQGFDQGETATYYYTASLGTSGNDPDSIYSTSIAERYPAISLQHIVFTRDSGGKETFYINGRMAGTGNGTGDFASWNQHTFKVSLCNSLGFENAWTGKLFLTALYSRALNAEQVEQNFRAGLGNRSLEGALPAIPAQLESTPLSAVAARLSWESLPGDLTGFVIERKEAVGPFGYVASATANTNEFIDEGLDANTPYQYRIKALNDFGESAYSPVASVTTLSDEMLENVALGKRASQSSTNYKGKASRGVDGNHDGLYGHNSVTHTAYELNAWWEVDLEDIYYIDHLEVWNRIDLCCKDRLARFYIFISEEPFDSHDFQTTLDQPGVHALYQEFFPDPMVTLNVAQKGRYIRLQLSDSQNINLAEMVVMGSKL